MLWFYVNSANCASMRAVRCSLQSQVVNQGFIFSSGDLSFLELITTPHLLFICLIFWVPFFFQYIIRSVRSRSVLFSKWPHIRYIFSSTPCSLVLTFYGEGNWGPPVISRRVPNSHGQPCVHYHAHCSQAPSYRGFTLSENKSPFSCLGCGCSPGCSGWEGLGLQPFCLPVLNQFLASQPCLMSGFLST